MKNILYTFFTLFILIQTTLYLSSCDSSNSRSIAQETGIEVPLLVDRKTQIGSDVETKKIRTTYENAKLALKTDPEDLKPYVTLATVYITESRITGNTNYYDNAAMEVLEKVIQKDSANKDLIFQALSYQAVVMLSMHQFKDALEAAKKGVALFDKNAGIYGALVDANVELGNYKEAVKMCDKMMMIRPDLRSYARASYLRQIHGDNKGAIEAMNLAVEAGYPSAEDTEWARVNLGELLLNAGDLKDAEEIFKTVLVNRPAYPYAEIGLAKVEKAKKNYDEAIKHTEKAIRMMSQTAFIDLLADLYELKGNMEKAEEIRGDIVDLLEQAQNDEPEDALIKHNGARELAMAYMKHGQLDKALENALIDLKMRPDNIDANELTAWIYYLKGDYANAKIHADKMLSTHVKNGNTLYKAGLIYWKAGDKALGKQLMGEAKDVSPYLDEMLMKSNI